MGASLIRYEPYTAPYNYEEAVNIVTTRKWLFLRGQGWKPVFKWKSLNILWEILSYTGCCHYIWTKSWQQYSLNTQYFMIWSHEYSILFRTVWKLWKRIWNYIIFESFITAYGCSYRLSTMYDLSVGLLKKQHIFGQKSACNLSTATRIWLDEFFHSFS